MAEKEQETSEDIVSIARKLYKKEKEAWWDIYQKAKNDLRFLSDDEYAQWDPRDAQARVLDGKPVMTIDQLGQFCHQVVNDIRMNTPSIGVIPADGEAKDETAEVLKGLIRNIEYNSSADDAYDKAAESAVRGSIGFIRVDHKETYDGSGRQELYIERVVNPFSILYDSASIEIDGCDGKHAFVIDELTVEDFEARYPGKTPASFDDCDREEWGKEDKITICEFFRIREEYDEMGAKKKIVDRFMLSANEVLEQTTFPGEYIPIVPVYGEEDWSTGKRELRSLIRRSKDAQRMYNYWRSVEVELLQKQPQSHILAPLGAVDGLDEWSDPNKYHVLRYNDKGLDKQPIAPPQFLPAPQIPVGIINAARENVDDIKATMGMYNASIGAKSNETSGIAIQRRQQEGDVATFHYGDNLVKSITQVGRILVCAIPEVYVGPQILRIIGMEDEPANVPVNGAVIEQDGSIAFDLTKGKYDVRVTTAAPFTTRRQEAADFFTQIVTRQPELMKVMGDLLFKYMDFAGAEVMAERMKKVIDPKFLDEEQQIDPEKEQMKQIIQQGAAEMQQIQVETQQKDNLHNTEKEAQRLQYEQQALRDAQQIAMLKLQLEEMKLKNTGMQIEKNLDDRLANAMNVGIPVA